MNMRNSANPIRNIFLNAARLAASFVAALATSAIIARHLGTSGMGLYSYVLWLSSVLVALSHFGLPTTITKYVAEYSGQGELGRRASITKSLLLIQSFVIVAVIVFGGLALLLLSKLRISILLLVLLIVLPQALQQAFNAALMGAQRFLELAWIGFCASVLQIVLVALVSLFHASLENFIVAVLCANLVYVSLSFWVVKSGIIAVPDASSSWPGDLKSSLKFSGPVAYLVLLDMIVWQRSEIFFLKRYSTLQEIAFYSLAFLLAWKLSDIVSVVTSTLLPLQAQSYGQNGVNAVGEMQTRATRSIQMVLAPICLFAFAVSKPLILVIYGDAFSPVAGVFWILLLSPIAISFTDIGIATIYTLGKQKSLLLPLSCVALLNLLFAAFLVPRHGSMGAAIATCSAQVLEASFLVIYSCRLLSVKFPWRNVILIYLLAALSSTPVYVLNHTGAPLIVIILAALLGCAAYVWLLIAFREIAASDWTLVREALSMRLNVRTA